MDFLAIVIYLPCVGALIGLVTKWAAIKLIFHPAEYVGIGPVGWQGVVQRRSSKFAGGIADTVTESAMSIDDLLARIEPEGLTKALTPAIEEVVPDLVASLVDTARPGAAAELGDHDRARLESVVADELQRAVVSVTDAVTPELARHVDVRGLVVEMLSGENSHRLADLIQRLGARELKFLIWYGGVLGFGIGAVAVLGYSFLERWWLLPIVGAIDGLVNNWLALQMIFRPLERTRYLGIFPYQGLFPARQEAIAHDYAAVMADEVLTPSNLLAQVASDAGAILPLALAAAEGHSAALAEAVGAATGAEVTDELRSQMLMAMLPVAMRAGETARAGLEAYLADALDIAGTLEENLAVMDKLEFEKVLRGIFEEDEKTLIALGGVLGGAIGLVQAGVLLAFGWA